MAIIKGRIRGGGRQLGGYLLSMKDNEEIRILDVDGQTSFSEKDMKTMLIDFSLSEQLTKSKKGLYHATYNPAEDVAEKLSDEQWLYAADVLAKELGFEKQRRVVVFQKNKTGRPHIHIAFERFDHEKGKMIPIAHNYRKHDRARAKLEQAFNEQPTQHKNARRAAMKECLTSAWQTASNGNEFIAMAKKQGYIIAKAYEKSQYAVVDSYGQSFKLVSHLKDVRIGQVRECFKDKKMIDEKDAIAFVRSQKVITQQEKPNPRDAFRETLSQMKTKKQTQKPRLH